MRPRPYLGNLHCPRIAAGKNRVPHRLQLYRRLINQSISRVGIFLTWRISHDSGLACKRTMPDKLDHATLEALRIRAVRSVQDGESPEDVAGTLRVTPRAMYRWPALYRRGGWNALKAKPLAGRPPKLNGGMLKWLYNTVTQKNPLQLKFQSDHGPGRWWRS